MIRINKCISMSSSIVQKSFLLNIFKQKRFLTINYFLFSKNQEDKVYKVTFSGLDKFTSIEDLNNKLLTLNEIKVLRINKLSNKNYGHADIITKLDDDLLKFKFESLKILGKSLKVRIRQTIDDSTESLLKKYTFFDFEKVNQIEDQAETANKAKCIKSFIDHIYEFIHNFYIKNLADNPTSIKFLLSRFVETKENKAEFDKNKINYDCLGDNNLFEIKIFEKAIFDYEYHINFHINLALMRSENLKFININSKNVIGKSTLNHSQDEILIPTKSSFNKISDINGENYEHKEESNNSNYNGVSYYDFTEIAKNDKIKIQIKRIQEILENFTSIIKNLEYTSYRNLKNISTGVYRNLNVKFNEDHIILTLMITSSKLTIVDLKIIVDALKYEFGILSNYLSIFIAFNEKVIAEIKNSSNFVKVLGQKSYLKIDNENQKHKKEIKIYPFDSEENLSYLKYLDYASLFNFKHENEYKDKFQFKYVMDLTSPFSPFAYLMDLKYDNFIFLKEEYKFNLFNINNDNDLLNQDLKEFISNKKTQETKNEFLAFGKEIKKDGKLCCINVSNNESFDESEFKKFRILKRYDMDNEIKNKLNLKKDDLRESLLVLNLKNFNLKINKQIKCFKYQIIISNSFSQILDYLKNFSNSQIALQDIKMKFIKDQNLQIRDIIAILILDN